MADLCIREHGYLIQGKPCQVDVATANLKWGYIANYAAWSFLEALAYSSEKENRYIKTASWHGEKALKIMNFVGVITTPDGTQIEILPKITEAAQDAEQTRDLLWKMLCLVHDLPYIPTTDADLRLRDQPLLEILIGVFLRELASTVRRGIRKDYLRIEGDELFLKGRLQVSRQLRQPISRQHRFQIEYDVFTANRAENRLIHSALIQVAKWSKSARNQQLARELRVAFHDISLSDNYAMDFDQWRTSRDMRHYQPLLPWVKLILNVQSPFTLKDKHAGISFLFPMEVLFEKYVTKILQQQLEPKGFVVEAQVRTRYLSEHPKCFQLKPDVVIYKDKVPICILDAKWKLIDQDAKYEDGNPDVKAGVSQTDVYQLFAYGHKYLPGGSGRLTLIYPKWARFEKALAPFNLGKGLILDVRAFDLSKDGKDLIEYFNSAAESGLA